MVYQQEKIEKKTNTISTCELTLNITDDELYYTSVFKKVRDVIEKGRNPINHENGFILKIDLNTGDFFIKFHANSLSKRTNRFCTKNIFCSHSIDSDKKNNFKCLEELTEKGFYGGQNRYNFWGIKYQRELQLFFKKIHSTLISHIDNEFFMKKSYDTSVVNDLYDLMVDFYLVKNKIKGHDYVYYDILTHYPLKKWLKVNDNKFLPAVLDQYGIKSKFLIKKLSCIKTTWGYNIKSLVYICKLFGDNYIDYITKFDVMYLPIHTGFSPRKFHSCKTDSEKKCILNIIQRNSFSDAQDLYGRNIMQIIHNVFEVRDFLEKKGYSDLKINVKNEDELELLLEKWLILKDYNKTGYKLRYSIPTDIKRIIEEPIIVDDTIFFVKLLTTKDDFILEGNKMKNCMGTQFKHGFFGLYLSLTNNKKTINIQLSNKKITQSYGKANSAVPFEIFGKAMMILTDRTIKYSSTKWEREKYDCI